MYQLAAPDHRQPVLVLSRPVLLEVLETLMVAAITTTRRGSPYEVALGVPEGLKVPSCVNLTNVFTVRRADLRKWVGVVSAEDMRRVCRALALATACDG